MEKHDAAPQLRELSGKIEEKRQILYRAAQDRNNDFLDEKVIALSRELDVLIVSYEKYRQYK